MLKVGDYVRVSAAHLRFIDPNAARGWPTTRDPGKGIICHTWPLGIKGQDICVIWFFESKQVRSYNSANLVKEKDVYNEAMRAEHNREARRNFTVDT